MDGVPFSFVGRAFEAEILGKDYWEAKSKIAQICTAIKA
jgi:hypothetical protein